MFVFYGRSFIDLMECRVVVTCYRYSPCHIVELTDKVGHCVGGVNSCELRAICVLNVRIPGVMLQPKIPAVPSVILHADVEMPALLEKYEPSQTTPCNVPCCNAAMMAGNPVIFTSLCSHVMLSACVETYVWNEVVD